MLLFFLFLFLGVRVSIEQANRKGLRTLACFSASVQRMDAKGYELLNQYVDGETIFIGGFILK
jgi:hypothetical protein